MSSNLGDGQNYGLAPELTPTAQSATQAKTVFGQVMFLVALTCAFAAAGAYIGRDLGFGQAMIFWLGALGLMLGMSFVRKAQNGPLALGLLFALGLLLGLAIGPTISNYASLENGSSIIWQSAGLTALFIAAFGAYGYATRRDLSGMARGLFWALLALIGFGIVMIFVQIPGGRIIYSVLGLVIFAGYTMYDFNRLRRAREEQAAMIAVSIFLDVFNVFLLLLNLVGGGGRN
jgi:FtsH-binding integral membrane protein